ncbi:unnamed protein product [Symbiodinium sp. CCMP2456]|nr:unnamed protein product [Symbiodinium sp. CCMP2456]
MSHETFEAPSWSDEITINGNVRAAEAARLAYHLCRHRYQVVIVQLMRWWSRKGRRVPVASSGVVGHVAAFALAVPAVPQILSMPDPWERDVLRSQPCTAVDVLGGEVR